MKRICLISFSLLIFLLLVSCAEKQPNLQQEPSVSVQAEESTAETLPGNFTLDPEVIAQFYIRWQTSRYDLLVTAETEPELFDYLSNLLCGEYAAVEKQIPSSGADSPTFYYYNAETLLGSFVVGTGNSRILYNGYWYKPTDPSRDFWGIKLRLENYETEEHELEFNGVGNYYFRAGTYGKERVEIPEGPVETE